MSNNPRLVYKVVTSSELADWQAAQSFVGNSDDQRDGFIHLSFAAQVRRTIEKHFDGAGEVIVAELDSTVLGEALRLESSRSGKTYPHVYRAIPWSEVLRTITTSEFYSQVEPSGT